LTHRTGQQANTQRRSRHRFRKDPGTGSWIRPWAGVVAALLCVSLGLVGCSDEKPRVRKAILVSIDTLRPDFLGTYNPGLDTSPNIDQLAERSTVFSNVLSHAPSTTISHKSALYSVYPAVHKTRRDQVPEENVTAPVEALRQGGFVTAAIVGGGGLAPEIGFPRGFDSYEVLPRLATGQQLETLKKSSRSWLRAHHQDDFFLFLHMYQPHCPYSPPEKYAQRYAGWYQGDVDPVDKCGSYYNNREMSADDYRYVRDLVKGEVAYADEFIGELLAELVRLGIDDETMIVLMSDHGDSLGERGYVGHNLLVNIQLRVPLIVHLPGTVPGRIDAPLELIDVMPTIFRALGQQAPYSFQGRDLVDFMEGATVPPDDRLRVANQGDMISLHKGSWHLVFDEAEENIFLYDLHEDPEEYDNLASQHPSVVEALLADHDHLMYGSQELAARFVLSGSDQPILGQESIERLRALGYIQ
jgi:arylsulfatase A-like enzyme